MSTSAKSGFEQTAGLSQCSGTVLVFTCPGLIIRTSPFSLTNVPIG